jgi:hypothetical protein
LINCQLKNEKQIASVISLGHCWNYPMTERVGSKKPHRSFTSRGNKQVVEVHQGLVNSISLIPALEKVKVNGECEGECGIHLAKRLIEGNFRMFDKTICC